MSSVTTTTDIRRKAPPVSVYTRASWSDPWTLREHLACLSVEFATNPTMPEAVLEWRYGKGSHPGETIARRAIAPLDIVGHYVKIDIDPDVEYETNTIPVWYGRIIEDVCERHGYGVRDGVGGGDLAGPTPIPAGVQQFICWGLESDLDITPVFESSVHGVLWKIGRSLPFNLGTGRRGLDNSRATANQYPTEGVDDWEFTDDMDSADEWNATTIVEYLLNNFSPREHSGDNTGNLIPWSLSGDREYWALSRIYPKIEVEGKTVRRLLDEICDRRRGLGWFVEVDETTDPATCNVVVFSHADQLVTMPDTGGLIPANSNQVSLDFDNAFDIEKFHTRKTEASRYDQVIVRGERIGVCFTITSDDGQIVSDWKIADQAAYEAAATGETGYADLEDGLKQARNDAFRMSWTGTDGARIERVFSWFAMEQYWNGHPSGDYDAESRNAMRTEWSSDWQEVKAPVENNPADGESCFWRPGVLFEKHLPLFKDEDYSGSRIEQEDIRQTGAKNEFMQPLVAIKLSDDAAPGATAGAERYALVTDLAAEANNEMAGDGGRNWSCHVAMREDIAGFILRVSGCAQQHKIAKNGFTPYGPLDDILPELDWSDGLVATVYTLTDNHLLGKYPSDDEVTADPDNVGKVIRRLLINAPGMRGDYVMPDTMVGVKNGQIVLSYGGAVRNDGPKVDAMARMAYEWYGRDRQPITLQYRSIRRAVDLGDLVTTIGQPGFTEDIRTAVTRIRYDLAGSSTTIQTQYAELDMRAM